MNFLRRLADSSTPPRGPRPARDRRRNRVKLGLEALEQRKVLSGSGGVFEGMDWTYSEAGGTGTLTFVSAPGSSRIDFQAQQEDLSPGDPGYNPNSNPIDGIDWTHDDDSGGVSITVGEKVKIVVERDAGDNTFVDDEPSFQMSVVPRTTTPPATPAPPANQSGKADGMSWTYNYTASTKSWDLTLYDQPGAASVTLVKTANASGQAQIGFKLNGTVTHGPTLAPGASGSITLYKDAGDDAIADSTGYAMTTQARTVTQTGENLGLAWRYTYDRASGSGDLFIQDAPGLKPTYVNPNAAGNAITFSQGGVVKGTASIIAGSSYHITVAEASGDSTVVDDRAHGTTSTVSRSLEGTFHGASYDYEYNIVQQSATLTFVSAPGSGRIDIQAQHQDLSPGDPGYVPNSNPIDGVSWTHDDDQGGVSFPVGTKVSVVIEEDAGDIQVVNDEPTFATITKKRS